MGKLSISTHENADAIEKMMVMLSISTKINAALESARITIAHRKAIMASEKHSHLSKFVITTSQLSEIIDSIYLKRKKYIPIFAEPECHNYYSQPTAHSWVSQGNHIITTLLQIPIAPMHQKSEWQDDSAAERALRNYEWKNVGCSVLSELKLCRVIRWGGKIRGSVKIGKQLDQKHCVTTLQICS